MSTSEEPQGTTPQPEQPPVRFRQLCKVTNDILLALSDDGVMYRRAFNESAEEFIWERLPTVSSTQLEARPCTYPGCNALFEVFPGGTDIPDECHYHRNRMF
jgi:hypothetical protein